MRSRLLAAGAVVGWLLFAGHAPRADVQGLTLSQSVEQTQSVDPAMVEQLPAKDERISFLTGHGTEEANYTGALLWSLLERSGVLSSDPRARVRRVVAVTGRDGYTAVLALAEIDPRFEGKQVLLAYRKDGQPMPKNELRLVVPGDQHGGRSVRDVVRIEIR